MPTYGNIPMRNPTGYVDDDETMPEGGLRVTNDPLAGYKAAKFNDLRGDPTKYGGVMRAADPHGPLYDPNEGALPRLASPGALEAFNRYTGGNVTRMTETQQGPQSSSMPRHIVADANFDSKGQKYDPRIGAPGDYALAKELTPEALPALERLASSGHKMYGKNLTTGQDIEYTPRKSVRPDVAMSIIQAAMRDKRKAERVAEDDKRFERQTKLASLPFEHQKELFKLEQNSPMAMLQLEQMRKDAEERAANAAYQRTQRNPLTFEQQETRRNLQEQARSGNPRQRAEAKRQLRSLQGINTFDDPTEDPTTVDEEANWGDLLAPSLAKYAAAKGAWTSGGQRQNQQVRQQLYAAMMTLARRAGIPKEFVQEQIAMQAGG